MSFPELHYHHAVIEKVKASKRISEKLLGVVSSDLTHTHTQSCLRTVNYQTPNFIVYVVFEYRLNKDLVLRLVSQQGGGGLDISNCKVVRWELFDQNCFRLHVDRLCRLLQVCMLVGMGRH